MCLFIGRNLESNKEGEKKMETNLEKKKKKKKDTLKMCTSGMNLESNK